MKKALYLAVIVAGFGGGWWMENNPHHRFVADLRRTGDYWNMLGAALVFGGMGALGLLKELFMGRGKARQGDELDTPLMTFRARPVDGQGRIRGNADPRGRRFGENHGQRPGHRDGAAHSGG